MSAGSDIEIRFSDKSGCVKAREIASAMMAVFVLNRGEYLRFDGMEKVNADGWVHYPERYVRSEKVQAFSMLWREYRLLHRRLRRDAVTDSPEYEAIMGKTGRIQIDGCRFVISGRSGTGDNRLIEHLYFQDFFSMLCFILAATSPDITFEGLHCTFDPESYAKRILNHAVYDKHALTFEQMEGNPVYGTQIVSWTRTDDQFMKCSRRFPFIRVDLITKDRDGVKQDKELAGWIRGVNDAAERFSLRPEDDHTIYDSAGLSMQVETASAELCFRHKSYPYVMLYAASRELCVKKRDELASLLSGRGYRTEFFSILYADECTGPHIVIPDSVTKIGDNAFSKKRSLKRIVIPDNVTEIGEDAFRDCVFLEKIVIPDSVTMIGTFAFWFCVRLKSVRLSQNLRKLSCGLFCRCDTLENIVIPDPVCEIGRYAFSGCSSLKEIVIPGNVREIGDEVFDGCSSLKRVVIPDTVTGIGKDVFKDCSPDLVIHGKRGSEAERYAAEYGLTFTI